MTGVEQKNKEMCSHKWFIHAVQFKTCTRFKRQNVCVGINLREGVGGQEGGGGHCLLKCLCMSLPTVWPDGGIRFSWPKCRTDGRTDGAGDDHLRMLLLGQSEDKQADCGCSLTVLSYILLVTDSLIVLLLTFLSYCLELGGFSVCLAAEHPTLPPCLYYQLS